MEGLCEAADAQQKPNRHRRQPSKLIGLKDFRTAVASQVETIEMQRQAPSQLQSPLQAILFRCPSPRLRRPAILFRCPSPRLRGRPRLPHLRRRRLQCQSEEVATKDPTANHRFGWAILFRCPSPRLRGRPRLPHLRRRRLQCQSETAYIKLHHLWRSNIPVKTKSRIFHSTIVPVLLYGLDTLSLEARHFRSIDGWYFRYLRRAIGTKASYYSRISNQRVWNFAFKPVITSQTILKQPLQLLNKSLATPPLDPFHHVMFSSGYKDRVKFTKKYKRGHPGHY